MSLIREKVIKWLLSHRILITAVVIIIAFAAPTIMFMARIGSERTYYIVQSYTNAFVIAGVVIAGWQYYISSLNAKKDFDIRQVQRAIDLSDYYKDQILRFFPAIRYVFIGSGAWEILHKNTIDQLIDFDSNELKRLFSQKDIEALKSLQESDKFSTAVIEANKVWNLGLDINNFIVELKKTGKEGNITIALDKNKIACSFMSKLIDEVLNNMEYFAMHFTHGTADESVVYQSLHQTYLDMVLVYYYYIANLNTEASEKYYTNVITLFEIWRKRRDEQIKNHSALAKHVQSTGTVIKKNE